MLEKNISEKKKFSIISRIRSTDNAWRGLFIMIKTTHNAWLEIFFGILALYMGFIFKITSVEWAILVFAIGLVLVSETINTAIEVDIDLTSPDYNIMAKDTKDISAAAVFLSCVVSGVVGVIIFGPRIISLL